MLSKKLRSNVSIFIVILLIIFVNYSDAVGATVKVGGSCTKVEALLKSGNQVLACTRSKSKLIWKIATVYQTVKYYDNAKAAAAAAEREKQARELDVARAAWRTKAAPGEGQICLPESKCLIGSKGPGGGTVFYDAGKRLPWGRYLEYAPNGWFAGLINKVGKNGSTDSIYASFSQDPSSAYCDDGATDISKDEFSNTSINIGSGKKNTEYLTTKCRNGAASLASSYAGGKKQDWYLPSKEELNEVCKFAFYQETGNSATNCQYSGSDAAGLRLEFIYFCVNFWTSSLGGMGAWGRNLDDGGSMFAFELKGNKFCVRPIRAF